MASLFGFGGGYEESVKEAPPSPAPESEKPTESRISAQPPTPPAKKGSTFKKAPVALIEVDDDSRFSVNPAAREILEELDGKVCVVSIAGLYRTGKSSLVNFLLDTEGGFTVGPTVRRCTRGVWMWGSPRRAVLASGEPCWVVVLDTEGLGGLEADQHYDTRIFALATLLCSTLVYNSLGSIDESAISNLSFVANLSQHIRVSDHGDGGGAELDAHEFHKFFPSFVWVVRDFALDLVDEYGTAITADEYLDRALRTQVGFDAATTERNRVRQMMTAFFTERHCFPLIRPLVDEAKLQQIDEVPLDQLRAEFREGVDSLKQHLYEGHLRPKEVNGRCLNGAAFIGLVEQYIHAIENGSVPTISTAWEEVMVRECAEAEKRAREAYDEAMDDALDGASSVVVERLYRAHAGALKKAINVFRQRAGGEKAASSLENLEEDLAVRLSEKIRENEDVSRVACEAAVLKLHEDLVAPKLASQAAERYTDVASLRFDLSTLNAKYAAAALGPAKHAVLAEYGFGPSLDAAQWLFERVDDAHEAKVVVLEKQCSEAVQSLAKIEAHEKVVNDTLEQQQRELIAVSTQKMQIEATMKAQEGRVTSLVQELQRANRRREELEADLEDTKEALESEQTWQQQLHQRLEDMETKTEHKESKLDELGNLLEQHKAEGEERAQLLEQHKERESTLYEQIKDWEAKHAAIVTAHKAAEVERQRLAQEHETVKEVAAHETSRAADLAEKLAKVNEDHAVCRATLAATELKLKNAVSEQGASAAELEAQLDKKDADLDAKVDEINDLNEAIDQTKADLATTTDDLATASKRVDDLHAELDGTRATHAELLRAHTQLGSEHKSSLQKMNQRITYLKSQLDDHHSSNSATSSELQRKAVREIELEKRLDVEINLRGTMTSDKEAQVFDLQKKLAEATTRLRQTESRATTLQTSLDAAQTELNQISAQRTVLLDEKEKMQALWEKSLTDHFNSLHDTQSELAETKEKTIAKVGSSAAKMTEMEAKLEEYRRIVERVETKKEGLLRKRTRSRLVKQTWHVKNFRLVGTALLHRETDNSGAGEKAFTLDANSKAEVMTAEASGGGRVMRNTFKVANKSDEIILAAIDRSDMNEWLSALDEAIGSLVKNQKKNDDTMKRFEEDQLPEDEE